MVLSLYLSRESSDFDEIWSVDSNFGSTNGHLLIYKKIIKFIMADSRHIENRLSAISPRFIVRLTQNFVWISRITFIHRSHDQNTKFAKIADDRHCENGFITIPQPGIIRFRWNLVCGLKFWFQTCWFVTNMKFKMADSRHIENRLLAIYFHELLSDWRDIWYVQVEPCSDTHHVTKIAIFENSRWRTAAILKMVSSLYLNRRSSDFNEIWCANADFGS